MEGFLDKKGRGKSISFVRPWSNRFFSLDPETKSLMYYSNDKTLKGNINIAGGTVRDIKSGDKPHMFEVQCSMTNGGGDVLVLNAATAADKAKWMECLQKHAATVATSENGSLLSLKQKLEDFNQEHIFHFVPGLSSEDTLFDKLNNIDIRTLLTHLEAAKNEVSKDCNSLSPPSSVMKWSESNDSDKEKLTSIGMEAICKSEVAAVIMSGGQGTRLGYKGPKGMYDIGLASGKSIFQLHMERLQKMRMLAAADTCSLENVHIPAFIMTSATNSQTIKDYFEEKNFFNFPREDVYFFEQGLLPCLTTEGQLILETVDALAMAPDGNGGIFPALKKSGAFQDMLDRKIKHLHIYGIDNVMTKSVDPGFIGYCISNNFEVANKVVPRANADEKVGVTAVRDGRMCIVEYSELPSEMTGCDENGKLIYSAANICNHYFSVDFLSSKVMFADPMYHLAHKKIPYYNPVSKKTETPSTPNGVKLEMFVFDVFPLAERWGIMEALREDEFAPVKNAPGSPSDSPDTARALLSDRAIRWLKAAGATLYDGGNDFADDGSSERKECEISPLLSYFGEGLSHLYGTKIPLPSCFKSPGEMADDDDDDEIM